MRQKLSSFLAYACILISSLLLIYYSKEIAEALLKLDTFRLINFLFDVFDALIIPIMILYLNHKVNVKIDRQEKRIMEKMTDKVIRMFKEAFKIIKKNGNLL